MFRNFCERCSAVSSENENVFYFRARVFNIRHHLQLTPSFIFSNTIIPKLRPQIPLKYFSKFQKPFLIHMPFKNRPLVSEPNSCKSFQFIIGFKLHFPTNEWPKLKKIISFWMNYQRSICFYRICFINIYRKSLPKCSKITKNIKNIYLRWEPFMQKL